MQVATAPLPRQLSAPQVQERPRSGTQAGSSTSKEKGAQVPVITTQAQMHK